MENNIPIDSDELVHWGIKGMKWGVRRYQNADGSLTPAGEKRRAKLEGKLKKLEDGGSSGGKKGKLPDADVPRKKTASEMDDNELARALTRARMEDEYRQRRPEPTVEKKPSLMKKFRDEALIPAATAAGKNFVQNALTQMGNNLLKGKVDPDSLEAIKATFDKLDYQQKIDKIRNPDKYLSEEDKSKRQEREHKAEDRAAKLRGYKDAADEAQAKRDAAEAARKTEADSAARKANEAKSNEYYNSQYRNAGHGEKTSVNPNSVTDLVVYNKPVTSVATTSNTNRGKSVVNNHMDDSYYDLIDRNGDVIYSWRDD